MKKHFSVIGSIIFIFMWSLLAAQSHKQWVAVKHCISGKYEAVWSLVSATCDSFLHHFNWTINQETDCGKKIWGKITSPGDKSFAFYYAGEKQFLNINCCLIKGQWHDNKTGIFGRFQGTLCKNGKNKYGKVVKWTMESGSLDSNFDRGCPDVGGSSLILYYKSILLPSRPVFKKKD